MTKKITPDPPSSTSSLEEKAAYLSQVMHCSMGHPYLPECAERCWLIRDLFGACWPLRGSTQKDSSPCRTRYTSMPIKPQPNSTGITPRLNLNRATAAATQMISDGQSVPCSIPFGQNTW